jgi:hypothetical protein
MVAIRLRKGKAADVRGAPRLLAEALSTVRAIAPTARIVVRADSKVYTADVVATASYRRWRGGLALVSLPARRSGRCCARPVGRARAGRTGAAVVRVRNGSEPVDAMVSCRCHAARYGIDPCFRTASCVIRDTNASANEPGARHGSKV